MRALELSSEPKLSHPRCILTSCTYCGVIRDDMALIIMIINETVEEMENDIEIGGSKLM